MTKAITLQTIGTTLSNAPIIIGSEVNGKSTIQNVLSTFKWNSNQDKEEEYVEKLFIALLSLLNRIPETVVKDKLKNNIYEAEYKKLNIHACANPARPMPKEYVVLSTSQNIYPFERIDIRFDYSVYGIKNIPYCDILNPVRIPNDKSPEEELWLQVEAGTRTLVINSNSPRSKDLQCNKEQYIDAFIKSMSYLLSHLAEYGL